MFQQPPRTPRLGVKGLLAGLLIIAGAASAAERIHFLIPAGPGGGLDSTARAIGRALVSERLVERTSFENLSGGGGGRAMGHFIETAAKQQQTWLVNSTPLIVRSLQGLFPHSYRDLIPIAGLIVEYSAFVVRSDSPHQDWRQVVGRLREDPRALITGSGSVRGSLDHIVMVRALAAAEIDPRRVRYLPYDGGGKAMLALLGGEADVIATGLGEALTYHHAGDVRILAIAAPSRGDTLPEIPTLKELGFDLVLANWRGVFAAPGTPASQVDAYRGLLEKLAVTAAWQSELRRYGWQPLNVVGDDFLEYLNAQEADLKTTMQNLGLLR